MSVFNRNHVDVMQTPMFLGDDLSIARYDVVKHPVFDELIEKTHSFFWRPDEINLSTDRIQYQNMSEVEKFFFTENLRYQILMDSIQGRAPAVVLAPMVSDPALDTWTQTWTFSETIHSRSYTHILRNCFVDPAAEFDKVIDNPDIMKRAESIGQYYDNLSDVYRAYLNAVDSIEFAKNFGDDVETAIEDADDMKKEVMRALYLCLHAVNALEAIRFYVSFACTFSFAERGLMEGNAKIMKFIARDEALHLKGTQYIIKQIHSGGEGEEFKKIAEELKETAEKIFMEVVHQEKDWVDHLFSRGSIPLLAPDVLKQYVEYLADSRMRAVGLDSPFETRRHPLPWIRKWLNSESVQVAAQEAEITYLVSQVDNDLNDESYKRFDKFKK